ncbi:fibronectin type III domain protein, partial [Cooperia oncophora]
YSKYDAFEHEFEAAEITTSVADVCVSSGQTARLQGKMCGYPIPEMIWLKNGQKMGHSQWKLRTVILNDDDVYALLVENMAGIDSWLRSGSNAKSPEGFLRNLNRSDVASSDGEIENKVKRRSLGDPKGVVERANPNAPRLTQQLVAPHFDSILSDHDAVEGEKVVMMVTTQGAPPPDVRFYRDGKLISDSDKYEIRHEPEPIYKHWLILKNAKKTEEAEYALLRIPHQMKVEKAENIALVRSEEKNEAIEESTSRSPPSRQVAEVKHFPLVRDYTKQLPRFCEKQLIAGELNVEKLREDDSSRKKQRNQKKEAAAVKETAPEKSVQSSEASERTGAKQLEKEHEVPLPQMKVREGRKADAGAKKKSDLLDDDKIRMIRNGKSLDELGKADAPVDSKSVDGSTKEEGLKSGSEFAELVSETGDQSSSLGLGLGAAEEKKRSEIVSKEEQNKAQPVTQIKTEDVSKVMDTVEDKSDVTANTEIASTLSRPPTESSVEGATAEVSRIEDSVSQIDDQSCSLKLKAAETEEKKKQPQVVLKVEKGKENTQTRKSKEDMRSVKDKKKAAPRKVPSFEKGSEEEEPGKGHFEKLEATHEKKATKKRSQQKADSIPAPDAEEANGVASVPSKESAVQKGAGNEDNQEVAREKATKKRPKQESDLIKTPDATPVLDNTLEDSVVVITKPLESRTLGTEGKPVVLAVDLSRPAKNVKWTKDGKAITASEKYDVLCEGTSCTLTIRNADFEDAGHFAVDVDGSESSTNLHISGKPQAKPTSEEVIEIGKDESIAFGLEFDGQNDVVATCFFNGAPLEQDTNTQFGIQGNSLKFCKRQATKADSGEYTVKLSNEFGETTKVFSVSVKDVPDPPAEISVSEIRSDSVSITWQKPLDDGGEPITGYVIMKKERGRRTVQKVAEVPNLQTSFIVEDLKTATGYEFSVAAVNKYGIGEAVEVLATLFASDVPDPPAEISVSEIRSDSVSITWQKPLDDGGEPITGYVIMKKERGRRTVQKVAEVSNLQTSFIVEDLKTATGYEFSVAAVNKYGIGEAVEVLAVTAGAFKAPQITEKPVVSDVSSDGCVLKWNQPKDDGGSPIYGYELYLRKDAEEWEKINSELVFANRFSVGDLLQGVTYEFKVEAVNEAGIASSSNIPSEPLFITPISGTLHKRPSEIS